MSTPGKSSRIHLDKIASRRLAVVGEKAAINEAGLACTFGHSEPGDMGIPRTVPTFEGIGRDFAPKVERYMDRELKKLSTKLLKGSKL
jgi:hypothetical protein